MGNCAVPVKLLDVRVRELTINFIDGEVYMGIAVSMEIGGVVTTTDNDVNFRFEDGDIPTMEDLKEVLKVIVGEMDQIKDGD